MTAVTKRRGQRATQAVGDGEATIPILLYHSVGYTPSTRMATWTVTPSAFAAQLDAIVEAGCTALRVSELVDGGPLPQRPVVITFDDGLADNLDVALPMLLDRGLSATVYVATGLLDGVPGPTVPVAPKERMLAWGALQEFADAGLEIGAHGHSHRPLDTLRPAAVLDELAWCRGLLAEELGNALRSFAYPFGYASPFVRRLVADAGFSSACGVGNALCRPDGDRYCLPRLTVTADTTVQDVRRWLNGCGSLAPRQERVRTQVWRTWRHWTGRVETSAAPANGTQFRPLAVATLDLGRSPELCWPTGRSVVTRPPSY
ncbi:MAG: polysaccharide deacetylase family protein [Egibacteraceae bacterium]